MRISRLLTLLCALLVWSVAPAQAAGKRASDIVRAELLAEPDAIRPGEPFTVGLRLTMQPNWHTYWRNPGDSGLPTEIVWRLPAGFSAGPLQWPTPERIDVGAGIVNYGYDDSVVLLATVTPPSRLPDGQAVPLAADVSFLVCERECIPGEAKVEAQVVAGPPAAPAKVSDEARAVFAEARARLPVPAPWPSTVRIEGDRQVLAVAAPSLARGAIRGAYFFPYDETAIDHAAAQSFTLDGSGLALAVARGAQAKEGVAAGSGVLVLEEQLDGTLSRQAFALGTEPAAIAAAAPSPPSAVGLLGLASAIAFAFLGGLVLNLMPCVFPVLSIKVLSLAQHSGLAPRDVRLSGLAYAAGVVTTFLALAGMLLALRAGGAELGWGFQLQSPGLVAALAFLLFALGLSLSGIVEFGTSLGRLGRIGGGAGLVPSFLTGTLATVVATPCTAPFMGAALGYALVAPVPAALSVFVALGLGMAAPFLVLTARPSLVRFLPRPGAWMTTLKQVLAFPIYATVAWLVFVGAQQSGPMGLAALLGGLVLVGFLVWTLRLAQQHGGAGRSVALGAGALAALALVTLGLLMGRGEAVAPAASAGLPGGSEPFTQARLDELRRERRPVLVNMTAAWCLTCLVNERTSLSSEPVRDGLAARGVVYLKGDWTNQNPEITRLLERNGRSGVPLYLLYPPAGDPVVLPQILTVSSVLDALADLPPAPQRRADLSRP